MIKQLDKKQEIAVRQKIITYDIFHGNKKWEYERNFFS